VTGRDRIVLFVVLGAALLAGFWFAILSPKRQEASKLDAKVAVAQQRLQQAQDALGQAEKAKREYESDYATVARLGKAVPKDDNMPSLLYQLQDAARGARVDFRSVEISGASQPTPPAPAATQASNAAAKSGPDSSASGSSSSSSSSTATPATPSAPATQAASTSLPPGATVGSAGFPTMPFQFTFQGSFFDMEHLLDSVQRFVSVDGKDVRVSGRLLTIDGIALQPQIFPEVKASITATAYLLPTDEDATGGATPAASGAGGQSGSSAPSATAMRAAG
jgi:hypothetical protein